MGFFSKLFGKSEAEPAPELEPAPEPEESPPLAIVILRRGMSVPKPEYVTEVLASLRPGLPESVQRFALAQPSWFKREELADSAAADVAASFAQKLGVAECTHRREFATGPEGAPLMVVELRSAG
jgi:hypothetical protein